MADFGEALKAYLVANAGIGSEFHWNIVPQGKTPPYVRLQTISDPRPADLDGYQSARESRVTADCYSKSWGQAREIAEKIIAATSQPFTQGGIVFGRVKAEGPRDLGEDTAAGYVHRASVDLLVWHREA